MNCLLCERVGIKPDGSPGGLDYPDVCDDCKKIYKDGKSMSWDYGHLTREELEDELDLWKQTSFFSDASGDPIEDPETVAKINMEMLNDIQSFKDLINKMSTDVKDDIDELLQTVKELDEKYRAE